MDRINKYYELSTRLNYMSDKDLIEKLQSNKSTKGWGSNTVIEIDGMKIFTKQIPIGRLEIENQFDTSNLYKLPLFYNYGVGSAGFGGWRELLMHVKTTNWVDRR